MNEFDLEVRNSRKQPFGEKITREQCFADYSKHIHRYFVKPPLFIAYSESHGNGKGLYTSKNLRKGSYVVIYHGTRISCDIADNLLDETYMFSIDVNYSGQIFDPPIIINGNKNDNSSCGAFLNYPNNNESANVTAVYHGNRNKGNLYIVTTKNIKAFSQLLLDYNN